MPFGSNPHRVSQGKGHHTRLCSPGETRWCQKTMNYSQAKALLLAHLKIPFFWPSFDTHYAKSQRSGKEHLGPKQLVILSKRGTPALSEGIKERRVGIRGKATSTGKSCGLSRLILYPRVQPVASTLVCNTPGNSEAAVLRFWTELAGSATEIKPSVPSLDPSR